MPARSYLFVPGDRPERFAKALAAGAHAVILDLEDAVTPERKPAAREAIAGWLAAAPAPVFVRVNPAGEILSEEQWQAGQGEWLCNDDDYAHINSLMKPCFEPGQYATWIAPPRVGINNQPQDFEYVRIEHS